MMKHTKVIYSGPEFRFGVLGTTLFFLSILIGLVENPSTLLLAIVWLLLLIGWKVVLYDFEKGKIITLNFTLTIPFFRRYILTDFDVICIHYIWEKSWEHQKVWRRLFVMGSDYVNYSRYFELRLQSKSGKKIRLNSFSSHKQAIREAHKIGQILNLPLMDEYSDLQQSAVQRRKRKRYK
jgi:hypothetical protein